MGVRSYRDLVVWQKAIALVTEVYRATESFPRHEIYGLSGRIRRAAVSIPSNIAEGEGRLSRGEFRQFLGHARGSAFELDTQVTIARDLAYIDDDAAASLLARVHEVGRVLSGLLNSISKPRDMTDH